MEPKAKKQQWVPKPITGYHSVEEVQFNNPRNRRRTFRECGWPDWYPVSVDDLSASPIHVYPNPTSTVLTIEAAEVIHSIRVYDLNGRLMQQRSPNVKALSIDVSGWPAGLYFVELSSEREVRTLKFVKD